MDPGPWQALHKNPETGVQKGLLRDTDACQEVVASCSTSLPSL